MNTKEFLNKNRKIKDKEAKQVLTKSRASVEKVVNRVKQKSTKDLGGFKW